MQSLARLAPAAFRAFKPAFFQRNMSVAFNLKAVNPAGEENVVEVELEDEVSVLQACEDNDIAIPNGCGGEGTCGTCQCVLDDATFAAAGKIGKTEATLLKKIKGVKPTSRLACQVKVTEAFNGKTVVIPLLE
ncbi:hypothetical protein WA158_001640 [Blastocystis sp. Blastoise]